MYSSQKNSARRPAQKRNGSFSRGGAHARRQGGNNRASFHNSRGRGGRGNKKMQSFNPMQFINNNPVDTTTEEVYVPKDTFQTFGLGEGITKTILSLGLEVPTPIQDQIIPEILKGRDVVGLAETGTGKTAAFLIPLIEKVLNDTKREVLILAPTRELAIQIENEMIKLSKGGTRLYSVLCVGGTSIHPQIRNLRYKNHFIIGTPGRVLDLINRGILRTEHIQTVVLDEADRMLDMGFIGDMRKILSATPSTRETLLFSATMSKDTEHLVKEFLKDPVTISVKKKDVTKSIAQDVVRYAHHNKLETLVNLFESEDLKRVIIFGAMKHSVEKLAQELTRSGIKSESIHGNKTHSARQRALAEFKCGNARVLVATDVAARGIHVDNVTHVINYDLPNTFDDYVHRIGRTGRGFAKGKALTFIPE